MTKCYDCEFFRYFNKSDVKSRISIGVDIYELYGMPICKGCHVL